MRILLLACALLLAMHSQAGPNWAAIEQAREEKAAENQLQREEAAHAAALAEHKQSAIEKLEAACARVANDKELSAACDEILAAYRELETKR